MSAFVCQNSETAKRIEVDIKAEWQTIMIVKNNEIRVTE